MEYRNYYDILDVCMAASPEELAAAKNALAKRYHPDVNMASGIDTTEQMQEVLEAYRVLSDPELRADYDRMISGRTAVMRTFDLREEEPSGEEAGFVTCWRASGRLYDIVTESDTLSRRREHADRLAALAMEALRDIFILREAEIPERYWHPDIMNWLLFAWFRNQELPTPCLLTLYDRHTKDDMSVLSSMRLRRRSLRYEHSVRRLMKY